MKNLKNAKEVEITFLKDTSMCGAGTVCKAIHNEDNTWSVVYNGKNYCLLNGLLKNKDLCTYVITKTFEDDKKETTEELPSENDVYAMLNEMQKKMEEVEMWKTMAVYAEIYNPEGLDFEFYQMKENNNGELEFVCSKDGKEWELVAERDNAEKVIILNFYNYFKNHPEEF